MFIFNHDSLDATKHYFTPLKRCQITRRICIQVSTWVLSRCEHNGRHSIESERGKGANVLLLLQTTSLTHLQTASFGEYKYGILMVHHSLKCISCCLCIMAAGVGKTNLLIRFTEDRFTNRYVRKALRYLLDNGHIA